MARITVEDCLGQVGDDNRFALVHLVVNRIKQRRQGAPLLIQQRKNKEIVMTLREIAAGSVTFDNIAELPIQPEVPEPEEPAGAEEEGDTQTNDTAYAS